ncbi:nucleotidyltransferase family protein [Hydrogenophaga sp. MI9]|uniref:nucleotidyltransferase family protein n=1 Tax=Hydrogenophaga sp. MI9 TaxID=3453719 RepID=UPI003EEBBAE5
MSASTERAAWRWLGLLLGPHPQKALTIAPPAAEDLLDCAKAGGLAALTSWRLQSLPECPAPLTAMGASLAPQVQDAAVTSMLFEREARMLGEHLHRLGMQGLLLKGVALAQWAYPQPHLRQCSDVDLLVPSLEDAKQLANHLQQHGYTWEQTADPEVAYELLCKRQVAPGIAIEVDIHWQVAVTPLLRNAFRFDELMGRAKSLPSLGPHAYGLGAVDAMLHASINRAFDLVNGFDEQLRLLMDFPGMARDFTPEDWQALTHRAVDKQLAGFLLNALEACQQHLDCQWPESVLEALSAAAPSEPVDHRRLTDWRYMQWKIWQSLPDWPQRLQWLRRRLLPNRGHLEHAHGTGHSYASLLARRALSGLRKLWR